MQKLERQRTIKAPQRGPEERPRLPEVLGWSIVAVLFAVVAVVALVLTVDVGGESEFGVTEAGIVPNIPDAGIVLSAGQLADAARYEALAAVVPANVVVDRGWQASGARLESMASLLVPVLAPDLTAARVADAARLEALAERFIGRAVVADAARWEGLTGYYVPDFTRTRLAETARWEGLAAMALGDRELARTADSARLAALADHFSAMEVETVTIHQPL
ncbi:MAG: hypothetical protein KJO84_08490 [Acidimicrobiia bacterium]|nr:hypothetical protein [Acidimicrobiia bacterium]